MNAHKYSSQRVDEIEFATVPGMVRLLAGDVVQLDGGPHIVVRSTLSGAKCEPLAKRTSTVNPRFSDPVTVSRWGRVQHISGNLPKCLILERRGEAGVAEYLAGRSKKNFCTQSPLAAADQPTTTGGEESDNTMAKKSKKAASAKSAPETKQRKGGLPLIMGHTTASVVRRLGKEGVKCGHAMAILEANGVKASKPGVQTMLFNGRHGTGGDPAPLTAAQVKELVESAAAPARANAAEPKEKA